MFGVLTLVVVAPLAAMAWVPGQPLVPECQFDADGPYCTACDLVNLVNNLLAFAVYLTTFVATIMFAYAGFLYVTAATNAENIKKAKDIFGKVLLGFVFVLTAWLIVDIVLSVLTEKNFGFWTNLDCSGGIPTFEDASVNTTAPTPGVDSSGTGSLPGRCSGADCLNQLQAETQFSAAGIAVVSSGNCDDYRNRTCTSLEGVTQDTVSDVVALNEALGGGVTVTAGTETGHKDNCHENGTCVDIRVDGIGSPGSYDTERINEIIDTARTSGRCLVFEPPGGSSCPAGVSSCQEVSHSTGSHFSFYECRN